VPARAGGVLLGLAGAAAFAPGCTTPCTGSGCEAEFSAARIGVMTGGDAFVSGRHAPLDAPWQVEGTLALGPDWSVALGPMGLVAGSPDDSAVRIFAPQTEGVVSATVAETTLVAERADLRFGAAVDIVPDLDGDGLDELLVGAPEDRRTDLTRHDGAAWLLSGAALGEGGEQVADDARMLTLVGDNEGAEFGQVLAGCPDLEGDQRGGLVVAAPLDSSRDSLAGRIVVAPPSTLDGLSGRVKLGSLAHVYTGVGVGARAGTGVDCAGDLDGDGFGDIVVGAPFADGDREAEGAIYVLSGAELPGPTTLVVAARRILSGLGEQHWAGWSVATGDLDGDGRDDLVAGAPGADDGAGMVLVWRGAELFTTRDGFPDVRLYGDGAGDGFGRSVAIADLDGDGVDDLLVGAPRRNPSPQDNPEYFDSGAVYVFRGAPDLRTWRPVLSADDADARWAQPLQFLRTGGRIATGDLDGDGAAEAALVHRFAPE
jgi:hypothetical protein